MNSENQYYIKLKSELIICPYCQKTVDMYYIQQHLKNKRCKIAQTLHKNVDTLNFASTDAKFRLFIYNLKQKILKGESTIESEKIQDITKKDEVVVVQADEEVNLLDL